MSAPSLPSLESVDPESLDFFTRPDYYDLLAELRETAPVYAYRPHAWALAGYDDVRTVSRDPENFCSGRGVLMNDPKRDGMEIPGSILHMDPPDHAAWRQIASRWFTPRAAAKLEERVRNATTRVLGELSVGDSIDLVDTVSAPIPVVVIAELLGIGDDVDAAQFRRWSDACIESTDLADEDGAAQRMADAAELMAFLNEQTVARRENPREDLLSELAAAEVDGRPLRDDEIVMYCLSILIAGNETTRHLLSGSFAELHSNPDQRRALAGRDAAALTDPVEECLRWVTPIQTFARTATRDLDFGGHSIEEGDWVVLLYASANRDEAAFGPTAGRFDALRPANPAHVAFGFGEHLCLGASLARLEARVVLADFLSRFPDYTLGTDATMTRSTLVRGHHTLPATL